MGKSFGRMVTEILFLEDHFETTHLGKIVGCIDHHPTAKR